LAYALTLGSYDLVVTETRFADGTWRDVVRLLREAYLGAKIVVLTDRGSIASAVQATRSGVHNYLVKPVTGDQLLRALQIPIDDASGPSGMSLGRAVYELLTQSVELYGSIAAAARALGLDRRSLRRMLAKNPPLR
jgi:two-component system response regulator RegA